MTVHQHAVDVGTFAQYLREMTARLDPGRGWYGVFTRRDPQGMRSCLDGVEIPPWDVVESLLADLAEVHGAYFAEQVSVRAAALYSASAAAHDRRPGGRQELVHRLELMIREQGRAAERLRTAGAGGVDPADPEAVAWAHDDHRRASARCAELRKRLAAVTVPHPRAGAGPERVPGPAPEREVAPEPVPNPVPESAPASGGGEAPGWPRSRRPAAGPAPEPAPRRKKPRGARFAGLDVDDEEATAYAPSPVPALPAPPSEGGSAPRGARFGGGPAEAAAEEAPGPAALPDPGAGEAVAAAVGRLVRLRAEGRSGEAHVVLCELAAWPAPRLPVLAVALYRAGLAADWTTLLWEASSLPPAGFAAAAGALAAAGRDEDCGLLLRQGVARPAAEVAEAVLALDGAGREGEARALLGAFVRVRTPQEAAELAGGGGDRVLPHLLAAAREVSVEREWDLIHALRVAGVPGV
ncbi:MULTISPECIES: hypothetical protein [unclassified Streptomyces]|uniref:hypothetical protein n=1 Tax=unclassified Streptomyces TaxID=2593676 RepID=UPI000978DD03|nr:MULTISPECIES: hypothetical protein [unclassified Streptomyces]ONI53322.1 hypothetical protein STIB_26750 [Streptomyces sp. IB2014 011-1]RDV48018.1 hypothetical protein DDV98_30660 [Streptomyces sp. IB2014 011-12]